MIRTGADLLTALVDHTPVDGRETRSLERIRGLLAWLPDPFNEDADPAHVTASGIVIDKTGRLLLHRHRRLRIWLQPGGHVDPGESLEEAVDREVREETGLVTTLVQATPVHVDLHEGPRGHLHLDIRWLLRADADAPLAPGPTESPDVAWFALDAAAGLVDAGLRGVLPRIEAHQTAT
ncbi:MAG: NUDIX domain-containing protein [Nitriliruptorales bacterium]|nr:NUDIX domain-containing protein [Nitriliruptorales bacterium]